MSDDLLGVRVLVVGASSGIGAAVVRAARAAGADVAAAARRTERLDALAAETGAVAVPLDVRDEWSVRKGVETAVEALGGLDTVVYTAGVSPLVGIGEASADDWRIVMDTNVIGCGLVAAAVAPHLVPVGGRLLVLSSKAVRQPFPDLGVYATSKFALDGLIRCLPIDLPGLLVTRVLVGNTHDTDFAASWNAERLGTALNRWIEAGVLGSGRTMDPRDVATAVLAVLLSPVHIDDVSVLEHPNPSDGDAGRSG